MIQQPSPKLSQKQQLALTLFGEAADVHTTRTYRKWKSMKARNLQDFHRQHSQTFIRRMRRGVPQAFRWEAWKEITGLREITEAANCDRVMQLMPPVAKKKVGSSSADENSSHSGHAPADMTTEEIEDLAQGKTPTEFYEALKIRPGHFSTLIDIDIARTFPEISFFDAEVQRSLHNILNAYANFAPHVGYCQGMNFVTGFILLVSALAPEAEVFWFFCILMSRYNMHGFFREQFPLLGSYIKTFDGLSDFYAPELRRHFAAENVLPPVYLHQWYLTLFVTSLPLGTVVVAWDFFLCIGLHAILPLTLALLKVLQSFLLRLKFEGIVKFLKSLRSSGDCDESKIGKMLVRQAENYPILDRYRSLVVDVNWDTLLAEPEPLYRRTSSLVVFDAVPPETAAANPLNEALIDQGDLDDDDAVARTPKSAPPMAAEKSSKKFLPKIIGRKR